MHLRVGLIKPRGQRVRARMDGLLRHLQSSGRAVTWRGGCAHSAAVARHPAPPLEMQANEGAPTDSDGNSSDHGVAHGLQGTSLLVGTEPHRGRGQGTPEWPLDCTGAPVAPRTVAFVSPSHRCPGSAHADAGMIRGREPADDGGNNPPSRRAGCEQHLSGSVRGAPGDRGAYSIRS